SGTARVPWISPDPLCGGGAAASPGRLPPFRPMRALRPLPVLLLAGWFVLPPQTLAESSGPDPGKAIYDRLCAECHGAQGEGVPGRHRRPLGGDLTLAELTRLIEATMPEDNPEACVGEDAANVARFVFQSFYSTRGEDPADTARVELVHLTQRQYLHAVADLIRHFQRDAREP